MTRADRDRLILALNARGMFCIDIRKHLVVKGARLLDTSTISKIIRAHGHLPWRTELARRRRHNLRVYVRHGLTSPQIAKRLGVTVSMVNKMRQDLGVSDTRRCWAKPWSPSRDPRVGRMTELYGRGLRDREIAQRLGVHPQTVCKWRKRLGIPPHPRSRGIVTAQNRGLMAALAKVGRPVTVIEMAEVLGVTPATLYQSLYRLRRKGLVRQAGCTRAFGSPRKLWEVVPEVAR